MDTGSLVRYESELFCKYERATYSSGPINLSNRILEHFITFDKNVINKFAEPY